MNTKTSTPARDGESIQTIYPTRRPTGSSVDNDFHARHQAERAMTIARSRMFYPFEYWAHGIPGIQADVEDSPADSRPGRAIESRSFKRPVILAGWLQDLAMHLFHRVRGP
jgi:hypothetical protein